MSVLGAGYRPPRIGPRPTRLCATFAISLLGLAVGGFLAGQAARDDPAAGPVADIDGVPVGIGHSAAGALAAADNYLAFEQQTIERDPASFRRLVALSYAPNVRGASIASAIKERDAFSAGPARSAESGENFTVIGAHRLAYYRATSAQVNTWAGEIYWGSGQDPTQVWRLGVVTLWWTGGRWLVSAMRTLPAPAPEPSATPQATASDDSPKSFERSLSGFSAVAYGAPTR